MAKTSVDPNLRDDGGETALHKVAAGGPNNSVEVVELLLGHEGTEVDVQDNEGWSPLMRAAWEGRADTVRLLMGRSADLDLVDGGGRSALELAKERGHEDVVELLVKFAEGKR